VHVVDDETMQEILSFVKVRKDFIKNSSRLEALCQKLEDFFTQIEGTATDEKLEIEVLPADQPQSAVVVQTFADGRVDIDVAGKNGVLNLTVKPESPYISVRDPERAELYGRQFKIVAELQVDGSLLGWYVKDIRNPPGQDTLVWFGAPNPNGPKPSPQPAVHMAFPREKKKRDRRQL
jgi:hypothetical protein